MELFLCKIMYCLRIIFAFIFSIGKKKRNFPKTYVIHYTPLVDRKKSLAKKLESLDIVPEWVEDYDREVVTSQTISDHYDSSRDGWESRMKTANSQDRGDYRELTPAEVSLCFKHREVIRRIAEGDSEYALILEDDAIFKRKSNAIIRLEIDMIMQKLPEDWGIVFIGGGLSYKTVSFEVKKSTMWKAAIPAVNCTSSFLITQKVAQLIQREQYFALPFDHELSYLIAKNNITVYHQIPYVMGQGSVSGDFKSELR